MGKPIKKPASNNVKNNKEKDGNNMKVVEQSQPKTNQEKNNGTKANEKETVKNQAEQAAKEVVKGQEINDKGTSKSQADQAAKEVVGESNETTTVKIKGIPPKGSEPQNPNEAVSEAASKIFGNQSDAKKIKEVKDEKTEYSDCETVVPEEYVKALIDESLQELIPEFMISKEMADKMISEINYNFTHKNPYTINNDVMVIVNEYVDLYNSSIKKEDNKTA